MTAALYDRIDAIERFAADVAHELKNPLTSLASAVEMLVRAPRTTRPAHALMAIVRADVKRIDRLITDISDASRLDAELSRETPEPVSICRTCSKPSSRSIASPKSPQASVRAAWIESAARRASCAAVTNGWARCSAT